MFLAMNRGPDLFLEIDVNFCLVCAEFEMFQSRFQQQLCFWSFGSFKPFRFECMFCNKGCYQPFNFGWSFCPRLFWLKAMLKRPTTRQLAYASITLTFVGVFGEKDRFVWNLTPCELVVIYFLEQRSSLPPYLD